MDSNSTECLTSPTGSHNRNLEKLNQADTYKVGYMGLPSKGLMEHNKCIDYISTTTTPRIILLINPSFRSITICFRLFNFKYFSISNGSRILFAK